MKQRTQVLTGERASKTYGLPGMGPWRILSQCPSRDHNTLRSTNSSARRGAPSGGRCVCPRAIDLKPTGRGLCLPGGGPWKILAQCPASQHNTMSASVGVTGNRRQCVCPRALHLKPYMKEMRKAWAANSQAPRAVEERERAERRAWRKAHGVTRNRHRIHGAMPVWWTGPWKILDECEAKGHNNVQRAARARAGDARCICPRALVLREQYLEKRYERERPGAVRPKQQERRQKEKLKVPAIRVMKPKEIPDAYRVRPDYSKGRCTKPWNLEVFTAALDAGDSTTSGARTSRDRARAVCKNCPIRDRCQGYVLTQEVPAGSWGGVWGELDVFQRVQIAQKEKRNA